MYEEIEESWKKNSDLGNSIVELEGFRSMAFVDDPSLVAGHKAGQPFFFFFFFFVIFLVHGVRYVLC